MHKNHTFYGDPMRACGTLYDGKSWDIFARGWMNNGMVGKRDSLGKSVGCRVGTERQMSLESLARVKSDEIVLFKPVPGVSDGLRVVYAYPNEYSVGITSL